MLNNPPQIHLLKTAFKRAIQKRANLIGKKIADKNMKVPKPSSQNNSETITNEHIKELSKQI